VSVKLEIDIIDHLVAREKLTRGRKVLLKRDHNGVGKIYSEELKTMLNFKIARDRFALNSKQDELHHPFITPLIDWAKRVRTYRFGSEFGKTIFFAASADDFTVVSEQTQSEIDPNHVTRVYMDGFNRFGERFDGLILEDLRRIGYDCTAVTCSSAAEIGIPGTSALLPGDRVPMFLSLKERDLAATTRQTDMSMGMYRAFALLINLHHSILSERAETILVDDIGEGLDFERSTQLIRTNY